MRKRQPRMISEDDWLEGLARKARGDLAFGDGEPVPGIPEVMPETVADIMSADVARRAPQLRALDTELARRHADDAALIANAQDSSIVPGAVNAVQIGPPGKPVPIPNANPNEPPRVQLAAAQAPIAEADETTPPPAAAVVKAPEADKTPPIVEQAKGLEPKTPADSSPPAEAEATQAPAQDEQLTTEQRMAALQAQIAQMLSADSEPQAQPEAYRAPPRKKTGVLDDEGAMWAALLDVFVNRGRGTPQILQRAGELADKRRNDQLEEDYRVAQINSLNRRGIVDPEAKQLQKVRLMQAAARLQMQAEHDKLTAGEYQRRMAETIAKYGVGSEQVKQVIAEFKNLGVPDNTLAAVPGMSMDTVKSIMPTLRAQGELAQTPQRAQAAGDITAAQTQARASVDHLNAGTKAADAADARTAILQAEQPFLEQRAQATSAGREAGTGGWKQKKFLYEASAHFAEKHNKELGILGLMTQVDMNGGAVPQSLAERLSGQLATQGIPKDRIMAWQGKQMIMELWSRIETGAAVSMTEDERFKIQNGLAPGATNEQIEAAYETMRGLITNSIKAGAANNPGAPDVLKPYVVDPYEFLARTPEENAQMLATATPPEAPPTAAGGRQTAYAQPPAPAQPPAAQRPAKPPRPLNPNAPADVGELGAPKAIPPQAAFPGSAPPRPAAPHRPAKGNVAARLKRLGI